MTSAPSSASNGILHNLFAPGPDTNSPQESKDSLDHVAAYVDTAQGAWDFFRVVENVLSNAQAIPSLALKDNVLLSNIRNVANTAGIGLSIPQVISDLNNVRRSFTNFLSSQGLPYSDPLRERKVAQAAKKSFLDTVNLTFTCSQATIFLNNVKLIALQARQLVVVNGLYNITSAISDGAEFIGECFKLQRYFSPEAQPRNTAEAAKLEEKKVLSWMTIAKDTASIAMAAIALVGIAFGIAVEGIAFVPAAFLVLGGVWLSMKIVSYFYNKIVVEAPPVTRQLAL